MSKPVTKGNAKAKKLSKNKVLDVRFFGTYFSKSRDIKDFSFEGKMPIKELSDNPVFYARSVIVKEYGPKRYPDWRRHREVYVELLDQSTADDDTPLELMDVDSLHEFILGEGLPVKVELYPEKSQLLQAIKDCLSDEKSFLEAQESLDEEEVKELERKKEALDLNKHLSEPVSTATDKSKDPSETL